MAIRYSQGQNDDLAPLISVGIDDDAATAWWAGVQRCFVGVAIASVLTCTLLASAVAQQTAQGEWQSDVPAGSLLKSQAVDEYYWQNPVAPVAPTLFRSTVFTDPEEVPAGSLHGQADEDFWINPVAPVAGSNRTFQQWPLDEQEPAGSLFGLPEEDLWQNPAAPIQAVVYRSPLFADPEEVPAGSLLNSQAVDEYYWQNPVAPVAASLYQRLPIGDLGDDLPATVANQPDEDFWQNQAYPVTASFYQRLPLGDSEEIPAGSLFGQDDEDFWANPVAPVAASNRWFQQWICDEQEPAGSLFGEAEEFFGEKDSWQNAVPPVVASVYQRLPLGDPEEIPVNTLHGQADEDFWANPVAPVAGSNRTLQQWPFDEQEPAGSLYGQFDEDFWSNPVAPIPGSNRWLQQWSLDEQESGPRGTAEEDYWQNPVASVAASLYRSPLFSDPEEVPAGSLLKSQSVDEYYWQNPAAPVQASNRWPQPWSFESEIAVNASTITGTGSCTQASQTGRGAALWFLPSAHRVTSAGRTPLRIFGAGESEQEEQFGEGYAYLEFLAHGTSRQDALQWGYGEGSQLLAISGSGNELVGQSRAHAFGQAEMIDVELELIAALLALS